MFAPEVGKLNGGGVVRSFEVTLDLHVTIVRVQAQKAVFAHLRNSRGGRLWSDFLESLMLSSPNTWTAFAFLGKANIANGLVATKASLQGLLVVNNRWESRWRGDLRPACVSNGSKGDLSR